MRDPNRIKVILDRLEKVWEKNPDLRLGQLIGLAEHDMFEPVTFRSLEDEELITRIESILNVSR